VTEPGDALLGRAEIERAFTALGERLVRRRVVADVQYLSLAVPPWPWLTMLLALLVMSMLCSSHMESSSKRPARLPMT